MSYSAELGYYPETTYPRKGTNGQLSFTADCSSYIAWLFHTAGRGALHNVPDTASYIRMAHGGIAIDGVEYMGSSDPNDAHYYPIEDWEVGDILVRVTRSSTAASGHAMMYVGPSQLNSSGTTYTAFMTVECNGLMYYDCGFSIQEGMRGNVYYQQREYHPADYYTEGTSDYNKFYIFRVTGVN